MKSSRNVCVVVASRANYGRVKSLLQAIQSNPQLNLQLIVGASCLLSRFGSAIQVIKNDGFDPVKSIFYVIEGENLITQAKSTGLGIIELTTAFSELKPDIVVSIADRFETMATAIAASYLNIPLAHIQGGEISGNIDDKVRNAITQLSDYHYTATENSLQRILKMGAHVHQSFNVGCPSIDLIANHDLSINNSIMSKYKGSGEPIDWSRPYLLILQHPVTTSFGSGFEQMAETLEASLHFKDLQKVVMWPNIDAGSDDVSKGIRHFKEFHRNQNYYYHINFSPIDFYRVLNGAVCSIGNSSAFLREASFLGAPTVLVGDRQSGREHCNNVLFVEHSKSQIMTAITTQLAVQRYQRSYLFGDGTAALQIADSLSSFLF